MTNAELIKALRCKSNDINDCTMCAYHNACYGGTLEEIAADALEAADEKIADCVAAIDALDDSNDAYIKENERLKKRIAELEAQMPKEGEWIDIDGTMFAECSVCGKRHYGCTTPYCDMCGARMKGEDE